MNTEIRITEWHIVDDKVEIKYSDGDIIYVSKVDFDRAFGAIINADKESVKRDFAIKKI